MFIIDGIKAIFKLLIAFIIFIGSIACWLVDLVFNFSGRDIEGTDADYVESYFIIAKDVDNDKIRYYEVNGKGNKRNADKFESEKFDEVVDLNRCFESYIDRDKNKVLNKYLDNCYMINQNGEDLSNESIYQDIAIQVSLLEHDMFDIKIYKIGDEYYVTRGLNVNIYIPYDLFKYDIENNKLIRICQTSDEKIIGFKKKKNEDYYTNDELKAEFTGYANQYIIRSTYVFENDKAVACYMEIESDNELFLKQYDESLEKNIRYEQNKVYFEWSDDYFEQKGKGSSKIEIEKFLKDSGFKIIK